MARVVEPTRREGNGIRRIPRLEARAAGAPLTSFDVTADSVVVTLQMGYEKTHRSVQVHWGDDTVEKFNLRIPQLTAGQNLPPNTLRAQHVYDVETVPSRVTVWAWTHDSNGDRTLNAETVEINPRYFVVQHPIRVDLTGLEYQVFEGYTHEFDISQRVLQRPNTLVDRDWRLEATIGGLFEGSITPIVFELEDSALAIDMSWEDEPLLYDVEIDEDDGGWGTFKELLDDLKDGHVEFDTSNRVPAELHPRHFPPGRRSSLTWRLRREVVDGHVDILLTFDASLHVPLDRGPGRQQRI